MIYPVALTPNVVDVTGDAAITSCVASLFVEIERNGIVFSLDAGALADEITAVMTAGGPGLSPLRVLWQRLSDLNRILPVARQGAIRPRDGVGWVEEGLSVQTPERLFAMFGRASEVAGVALRDARAIAIEDAATSGYWRSRRSDRDPERSCTEVIPPLGRIVRFSRKVWLIDYCILKHLEKGEVWKIVPAVAELLRQWTASAVQRVEFKVVTENASNYGPGVLTRWVEPLRRDVQPYLPGDNATVAVAFYNAPHRRFHRNRFLLTDVACVQVGKGFDLPARPSGGREILTLLSDRSARAIENDFDLWGAPIEISLR